MTRESETYQFDNFRLDVGERRLVRLEGRTTVSLPEKAFQTLVHFVRHCGILLTKEELLEAVWPDTAVEENNLVKAIYAIRRCLDDMSESPRFIETVPKHGYRFIAQVHRVETDETEQDAAVDEQVKTLIAAESIQRAKLVKDPDKPPVLGSVVALAEWRKKSDETETEGQSQLAAETSPFSVIPLVGNAVRSEQDDAVPETSKRRKGIRRGGKFLIRGAGMVFLYRVLFEVLLILRYSYVIYLKDHSDKPLSLVAESTGNLLVLISTPIFLIGLIGGFYLLFGIGRIIFALIESEHRKWDLVFVERIITAVVIFLIGIVIVPNLIYSYQHGGTTDQIQQRIAEEKARQ